MLAEEDGLGVFLKEEGGEDYLIFNFKLERKVEIIDNEFEEERTTVLKAIIAKLPQVILNLIPVLSSPSHDKTPGGRAEKQAHLCRSSPAQPGRGSERKKIFCAC